MGFDEVSRIGGKGPDPGQFREELRGISVDGRDRLHAVGDSSVMVFDGDGRLLKQWETSLPGFSVAVDEDGRVWVGQWQQVEIYDAEGGLVDTWRDTERLGLITAIGLAADDVFLADASARWIHRYDREGTFLNHIGDKHRKGGFHIPNGVVDFAVDRQGHFGRFDGRDPEGFPGCCNPTNLTVDGAGRVIVSEKAGPRAKVYDPEGRLLAVVSDDAFDPGAKNMDLAVDSRGRIYVADTVKLEICVFAPESGKVSG